MEESVFSEYISEDDEPSDDRSTFSDEHNKLTSQFTLNSSEYLLTELVTSDDAQDFDNTVGNTTFSCSEDAEVGELSEKLASQKINNEVTMRGDSVESFITATSKPSSQPSCWTHLSSSPVLNNLTIKQEYDESNDADVSSDFPSTTQLNITVKLSPRRTYNFNQPPSPILRTPRQPPCIYDQSFSDELSPDEEQKAEVLSDWNDLNESQYSLRQYPPSVDIFEGLQSSSSSSSDVEDEVQDAKSTSQLDTEIVLDERCITKRRKDDGVKEAQELNAVQDLMEDEGLKEDRRYLDGLRGVEIDENNRMHIVDRLFGIFNKQVFDNKFPLHLNFFWNSRFISTAGMWNSCALMISLSSKLLTNGERLRDTLLHELMHAAVSFIDGKEASRFHAMEFQKWANKARLLFPSLTILSICESYGGKRRARRKKTKSTTTDAHVPFRWRIECPQCKRSEKRQYCCDMIETICECGGSLRISKIEDQTRITQFFQPLRLQNTITIED
ncbi:Acidic repeat-containing protein-like protein [Aphelenchoides besseyi]|nr:Acidic repeat-containing protein-like protein [Aphelenchoides besseyi]